MRKVVIPARISVPSGCLVFVQLEQALEHASLSPIMARNVRTFLRKASREAASLPLDDPFPTFRRKLRAAP